MGVEFYRSIYVRLRFDFDYVDHHEEKNAFTS